MKHASTHTQSTRQTTVVSSRHAATGPNRVAIAPPAYGIDFVDGQQTQEEIPIQCQVGEVRHTCERQQENRTGLPYNLKAGIETLSGMSLDDVRVHYNSSKPAMLQAVAYTQGSDIHVGPGQEQHLPHEAWHVVQQKQERVQPTLQAQGVVINDDIGLEHEAGVMGAKALWLSRSDHTSTGPVPSRARSAPNAVIQRQITGQLNPVPLEQLRTASFLDDSTLTYADELKQLVILIKQVMNFIPVYNANNQHAVSSNILLKRILETMRSIEGEYLSTTLPNLVSLTNQSEADKQTYKVLLSLRDQWTPLMRSANDEIASSRQVQRAGAGKRPDVKSAVRKTFDSSVLNLTLQEKTWVSTFLAAQGTTDKTVQEALTAIWALRQGHFQNLRSGKPNPYKTTGTDKEVDVEYQTTDPNKPRIWDQKAIEIGKGQTGFEGRLDKTHNKAVDAQGNPVPVGLLFDSTFVDERNYEIAWGTINEMLLSNAIPPGAIKEVRAGQPGQFLSDLHVNMVEKIADDDQQRGEKQAIKWAENAKTGQQNGMQTITKQKLPPNDLNNILNGSIQPYNRYSNDRGWLPLGVVYNEYGTGISDNKFNKGKLKFVLSEDLQIIYLTVTHYTGFSVTPSGGQPQARNPFYRIV